MVGASVRERQTVTTSSLHTTGSLANDLTRLGLPQGAIVMIHASLRRIGPVAGGAEAVLAALREALGERATLVMPLGSRVDDRFDAKTSPAEEDIGVLAEVFRRSPGTVVNDHAAARFGAAGPAAARILEPVPLHDYYGAGSALERFTELGGLVLRIGADIDTVTVTHHAEYLARLPAKRRARRRYLRADIGEQWIESLDDTDGIIDGSGGEYFSRILLDYLGTGRAVIGRIGNATAEWFRADDFVPFAVRWMETNLAG